MVSWLVIFLVMNLLPALYLIRVQYSGFTFGKTYMNGFFLVSIVGAIFGGYGVYLGSLDGSHDAIIIRFIIFWTISSGVAFKFIKLKNNSINQKLIKYEKKSTPAFLLSCIIDSSTAIGVGFGFYLWFMRYTGDTTMLGFILVVVLLLDYLACAFSKYHFGKATPA